MERTLYIIDLNDRVSGKLKGVQAEARKTDNAFKELKNSIVGIGAGLSMAALGREIIQTTAHFQSLSNSIKFASDTAGQGELSLFWLKDISKTYGLPLQEMTEGFKTFQGAMMNTKFTSGEVRNMFRQVSTGVVAMGLSADDAKGVFLALGQIMGKGKVQAEELRGQIGERVPSAFAIAARSMGMTSAQLDKFMSDGKLLAEDFLPKFAAEMEKTFGEGAIANADALNANINRLTNSWKNLVETIGSDSDGLISKSMMGWSMILDDISSKLKSMDELIKERSAGGSIQSLSRIESRWQDQIDQMKKEGKSREEIEKFLNDEVAAGKARLTKGIKSKESSIAEIEAMKLGKTDDWYDVFLGESGKTTRRDLYEGDETYKILQENLKGSQTSLDSLQGVADKLISSLYMPANVAPEKTKTKKQGLDGLTLNESRNGSVTVTFNIDTFQKNVIHKTDGLNNGSVIDDFANKMALALQTVLNDAAIVAKY